jgi:hypothetical protein
LARRHLRTGNPVLSRGVSPNYHPAAAASKIAILRSRQSRLRQSVERVVRNRRAIFDVRPNRVASAKCPVEPAAASRHMHA